MVKVGYSPASGNRQIVNLKNSIERKTVPPKNTYGSRLPVFTLIGLGYHLLYWTKKSPEIAIEMLPEVARQTKPKIGVWLVCRLIFPADQDWPIVSTKLEREVAADQEAINYEARRITTYIYSIWVINKPTGEIIGKINMEEDAKGK
jgi:hypothetical protein